MEDVKKLIIKQYKSYYKSDHVTTPEEEPTGNCMVQLLYYGAYFFMTFCRSLFFMFSLFFLSQMSLHVFFFRSWLNGSVYSFCKPVHKYDTCMKNKKNIFKVRA